MGLIYTTVSPDNPLFRKFVHTRRDTFKYGHQSVDENGDPFDYAGSSFQMMIREHPDDDAPVVTIPDGSFSLSASAAGTAAGVSDIWEISHAATDFADLTSRPVEYYFDIQWTNPSGEVFTLVYGKFLIRADVTYS